MATTIKRTVKKTASSNQENIVLETKEIDVKSLRTYSKNPRVGDVDLIAESLKKTGQYRPILVNKRTMEVLAGNHTLLAVRKLGRAKILASFVDVDEDIAKRIVLADNKTAQAGGFDETALAELLASLGDIEGTGYNAVELDEMIKNLGEEGQNIDDIMANMPTGGFSALDRKKDPRQEILDNEDEEDRIAARNRGASRVNIQEDADELEDLEDVETELQAVLELREDMRFDSFPDDFWEIPRLREDMLLDKLPENLMTWGGNEATPDNGTNHYLYNYGIGGIRGLPFDRSILCFFTHDHKFGNWWDLPAYYTAKVISSGVRTAVCPDFSFYDTTPRIMHLQGVYQSMWLGRFFQEAGMKVIPRIQFADKNSLEFNLSGIPKNPPVVAISVQNIGRTKEEKEYDTKKAIATIQASINKLEPTNQVLIYGGNPAKRIMEQLNLHGAEGVWIENYSGVRRGTVYDKKDGINKLTKGQKDKIRQKAQEKEAQRLGVSLEELKGTSFQDEDEDE